MFRGKRRSNSAEDGTIIEDSKGQCLGQHSDPPEYGKEMCTQMQEQEQKQQGNHSNFMRRISGGLVLGGVSSSFSDDEDDDGFEQDDGDEEDITIFGIRSVPPNIPMKRVSSRSASLRVLVVEKIFCVISDYPYHSFFAQLLTLMVRRERVIAGTISLKVPYDHAFLSRR